MTAGAARSVYGVVIEDGAVNAAATAAGGTVVACRHCAEILGGSGPGDILALAVHEGPPAEPGPGRAGPQIIASAADYVDAPAVFRQYCCPGCWTALYSAVVPASHTGTSRPPSARSSRGAAREAALVPRSRS